MQVGVGILLPFTSPISAARRPLAGQQLQNISHSARRRRAQTGDIAGAKYVLFGISASKNRYHSPDDFARRPLAGTIPDQGPVEGAEKGQAEPRAIDAAWKIECGDQLAEQLFEVLRQF